MANQHDDALFKQVQSALRKPWPEGNVLKIVSGVPTWAPEAGGGGGGDLSWVELDLPPTGVIHGSYGKLRAAKVGDLLYVTGSLLLRSGLATGNVIGSFDIDVGFHFHEARFPAPLRSGSTYKHGWFDIFPDDVSFTNQIPVALSSEIGNTTLTADWFWPINGIMRLSVD